MSCIRHELYMSISGKLLINFLFSFTFKSYINNFIILVMLPFSCFVMVMLSFLVLTFCFLSFPKTWRNKLYQWLILQNQNDTVSHEFNILAVLLKKTVYESDFLIYDLVQYAYIAGKNVLVLNVRSSHHSPPLHDG